MRALLDFPDRSGSDPSLMLGPTSARTSTPRMAATEDASPPVYVPGPFHPLYPSGLKPLDIDPSLPDSPVFASGGFHPQCLQDVGEEPDEPLCREPQSVVVTATLVSVILAAAGYLFDIH